MNYKKNCLNYAEISCYLCKLLHLLWCKNKSDLHTPWVGSFSSALWQWHSSARLHCPCFAFSVHRYFCLFSLLSGTSLSLFQPSRLLSVFFCLQIFKIPSSLQKKCPLSFFLIPLFRVEGPFSSPARPPTILPSHAVAVSQQFFPSVNTFCVLYFCTDAVANPGEVPCHALSSVLWCILILLATQLIHIIVL